MALNGRNLQLLHPSGFLHFFNFLKPNIYGVEECAQLILSPRYQLREHGRISCACFDDVRGIIPGLQVTMALFALCH